MTTTVKLRKQTPKSKSLVLTLREDYVQAFGLKEGEVVQITVTKLK